ncbi:MAG: phosphatidylserine decarboxylase family protein [Chlorobi bacterium]|nr:phosphatidylserine decarboxylase family protein [Chlorobiota bacterium]
MTIHKEGRPIIIILFTLLAGLNIAFFKFIEIKAVSIGLFFLSIIFYLLIIYFFRKPNRTVVINKNQIIAPADGTLVALEEINEQEYFSDKRIQVSIFMSPLNVHINWSPIKGILKFYKYHPGKNLVAWHPKSSSENERTSIVLENEKGQEIMIRQIAGAVARRIVCYAKNKNNFEQGQEIGFIKFGSRVDLILPLEAKIMVKLDQKITGKQTVIAELD